MRTFSVNVTQKDIDTTLRYAKRIASKGGLDDGGPDDCPLDMAVARVLPGARPKDVMAGENELEWNHQEIARPTERTKLFMKKIDATRDAIKAKEAEILKPPKPGKFSFILP